MKLFQRLLVAPALLGLLTPMNAKATDINLDAISNYNQNEIDLDSNSFKSYPVKNSLILLAGYPITLVLSGTSFITPDPPPISTLFPTLICPEIPA